LIMARGTSSRAASEFSSVRARAYPGIWQKKTQEAIDKNIRRDGESFSGEKSKVASAVRAIAKILKKELPASTFSYTDVVEGKDKDYPYQIEATFSVPGGGQDTRRIGFAFAKKEDAEQLSQQLSEGMDLTDNGRPLDLRRVPDEGEEQKDLDDRDRARQQAKEQRVADKRQSQRNYDSFVASVKRKMEAEREEFARKQREGK
jgi:hypothetical protein